MKHATIKISNITANSYNPTPTEECQIDDLANAIIELDGLARPLVVTQVSFNLYQLMEPNGMRFAAVKWATQISPLRHINCMIVSETEVEAIATQLKA